MAIVGIIGIIVALALFLFLVYKGCAPYWVAVVCAIIVAVTNLVPGEPFFAQIANSITGPFVDGLVEMVGTLFSVIFMGAILGKLYNDTGAAEAIALTLTNAFVIKRKGKAQLAAAVLVVWFVAAVCTMGGIDGYVLTFTMFPICLIICEMCDIPRRFIPGLFCLNVAFMTAPGAPQIYNIMANAALKSQIPDFAEQGAFGIVQQLEEVSSLSGLIPGLVATLIITVGGVLTLIFMINRAKAKGEHFEYGPVAQVKVPDRKLPNFVVSLLPLAAVFVVYTVLGQDVFIALLAGILLAFITMGRNLPKQDVKGNLISLKDRLVGTLNQGSGGYPGALMTVATPSALAGVITSTAAFGMIVAWIAGLEMPPYMLLIFAVCLVVAITSSPPVAIMIAVPMVVGILSGPLLAMATDAAAVTLPISANAIFRISALAASTFETLPVNGLIILSLSLAKTNHKQSYLPMFLMTVAYTLVGTIVAAAMFALFPGLG